MNYKQRLFVILIIINSIVASDRLFSKLVSADAEQRVLGAQKSERIDVREASSTGAMQLCAGGSEFGKQSKNPWNDLTPAQQRLVKEGQQILIKEDVAGDPWPCFHVYRLTRATPLQVAAVFWDVAYDANYIPDCLKSTVDDHPAINQVDATYVIRVPFLPSEVSKVRSAVKTVPGGGYKIEWNVLSSKYSKSSNGSVFVVPYENGALISYTNFVVPGSSIAVILRGQAESQVQKTVAAIAGQVESEVKSSPAQLAAQIQQLEKALGAAAK